MKNLHAHIPCYEGIFLLRLHNQSDDSDSGVVVTDAEYKVRIKKIRFHIIIRGGQALFSVCAISIPLFKTNFALLAAAQFFPENCLLAIAIFALLLT